MTDEVAAGRATAQVSAVEAWMALNDRQQGLLEVVYELDQQAESSRRAAGARGEYDRVPASVWRAVDFAHEPSLRSVVGWTDMQLRLERRGWDNQGNGSTVAALEARGLLTRASRPTNLGRMTTVALTRKGRAAARAGTSTMPSSTPKPALSARSWEVLALLWAADQRGDTLRWSYSRTIELSLIEPPLATADANPPGYAITERGREFYRAHYAVHVAAYPDAHAAHPDGAPAEPWPAAADEILAQHRAYYHALRAAWQTASNDQRAADAEAASESPVLPGSLPAAVTAQIAQRHQLWRDTARTRAALAATHAEDLRARAEQAACGYAVAAVAAFEAATAGADPLAVLAPPAETDGWDEHRLAPPPATGIHAIDAKVHKLHAAAVGAPVHRRGPAPRRRRARGAAEATAPDTPALPGADLASLADFLSGHLADGALTRRLLGPGGNDLLNEHS